MTANDCANTEETEQIEFDELQEDDDIRVVYRDQPAERVTVAETEYGENDVVIALTEDKHSRRDLVATDDGVAVYALANITKVEYGVVDELQLVDREVNAPLPGVADVETEMATIYQAASYVDIQWRRGCAVGDACRRAAAMYDLCTRGLEQTPNGTDLWSNSTRYCITLSDGEWQVKVIVYPEEPPLFLVLWRGEEVERWTGKTDRGRVRETVAESVTL